MLSLQILPTPSPSQPPPLKARGFPCSILRKLFACKNRLYEASPALG